MTPLVNDPVFKIYALCSVFLSMQMLILGAMTAATRSKHKGYTNPEDHKVAFKDAKLVEGSEHPDVARIQRAHRNLLESLPMFLGLGLIAVLAGALPLVAQICICTFTAARLVHSIVYIKALQPFRTMSFGMGTLSLIVLSVTIVLAVLG